MVCVGGRALCWRSVNVAASYSSARRLAGQVVYLLVPARPPEIGLGLGFDRLHRPHRAQRISATTNEILAIAAANSRPVCPRDDWFAPRAFSLRTCASATKPLSGFAAAR